MNDDELNVLEKEIRTDIDLGFPNTVIEGQITLNLIADLRRHKKAVGEMFEFWREHDGGDSAELWIKEWVTKHAALAEPKETP